MVQVMRPECLLLMRIPLTENIIIMKDYTDCAETSQI